MSNLRKYFIFILIAMSLLFFMVFQNSLGFVVFLSTATAVIYIVRTSPSRNKGDDENQWVDGGAVDSSSDGMDCGDGGADGGD